MTGTIFLLKNIINKKVVPVTVFTLACLLTASVCFARPPQSIALHYDSKMNVLKMDVKHISKEQKYHYIRTIKIFKNDKEEQVIYNRQQVNPSGFEDEFEIVAEDGDELKVSLYCSKGGVKSETLTVTESVEEEVE